jgi:CBS domain-containing protein
MRKKLSPIAVRDVMKSPPVSILPEATLKEAILTMANKNIGFVVLMRGDQLVGVVSERDIVKALASGISLDAPVEKIATKRVITIEASKSIAEAADLMAEHRIRHLVVVDRGRPVGVVSLRDLVKLMK